VLEIYWEIEKGHGCLERRAQTVGRCPSWKTTRRAQRVSDIDCEEAPVAEASTAPPKLKKQRFKYPRLVTSNTQQRYIRIDEECWRRHLWLCDLGLED
jgi:hypothetical protein